jgi:hypothetical protein
MQPVGTCPQRDFYKIILAILSETEICNSDLARPVLPISSYIQHQAFAPATVEQMSQAFDDACKTLGIADRMDPLMELVAKHIIKLAQRGVAGRTAFYLATMKEFRSSRQ